VTTLDFEIPGYEIIKLIGKGGMASVYQANQLRFNRNVAIKILSQDLCKDEEFTKRFLLESRIIAKLNHSHIINVFDVGEVQGHYYIALEYLSGGGLHERIKAGISLSRALLVTKQIASALSFAHKKGIVHRDIKPDNVMFREDGAAVLTDFGIAKEMSGEQNLTQTGVFIGTPKYMSPEQIRGAKPSIQGDIYSLGVLFYQMLTNRVPFQGDTLVATLYKKLNEPVPSLPPQLAKYQPLVNAMLAHDEQERIRECDTVVSELERLEQSLPSMLDDELTALRKTPSAESASDTTVALNPAESLARQETSEDKRTINRQEDAEAAASPQKPSNRVFLVTVATAILLLSISYTVLKIDGPESEPPQTISPPSAKDTPSARPDRFAVDEPDIPMEIQSTKADPEKVTEPQPQQTQKTPADPPIAQPTTPSPKAKTLLSFKQSMQVAGLLQGAALDEKEGRLFSPKGNNAKEKYQRVLSIDPGNATARERLLRLKTN
jgi:serine/threonine protein kinase